MVSAEEEEKMQTGDIIKKLAEEYPVSMAMSWDNPGLQVGRLDRKVTKVLVALDATDEVIEQCIKSGAELLVTHHPLLMSGIRKVVADDLHGKKVLNLIEHGIAHYAMHTNYDVILMTELAKDAMNMTETEVLEVTGTYEDGSACGIGCTGNLPEKMTARDCCAYVKKAFHLDSVRLFGDPERQVQRVALSPGSGKSMIGAALKEGAELLITGDIGHHDGLDAVDQGMLVMDAGHYGIEHIFMEQMTEYLQTNFPEVQVECAVQPSPFLVI